MNIIFMGTPDFAVPSLDKLYYSHHHVSAVVTVPDKPRGRGQKLSFSAVKEYALEHSLPVLQPKSLKDNDFLEEIRELKPDIFIVVAFRILPKVLFQIPKYGAVNAHASLLPKYRGAAPIHWAVYSGEKETGVTTFKIDASVDTGSILLQKTIPITADDTSGTLYERLKFLAADALLATLDLLETESYPMLKQDENLVSKAPKVFPEMGELDFSRSAEELVNHIRAFTPFPGAYFLLNGKKFKVLKAHAVEQEITKPFILEKVDKHSFAIQCGRGLLLPDIIQQAGKKAMPVRDFLNGFPLYQYSQVDHG